MERKRILLIENDEGIRGLLVLYLNSKGYDVIPIKDYQEALLTISNEQLDLIILDIEMPKVNEDKLWRKMRYQSSIPIIFTGSQRTIIQQKKLLPFNKIKYMTKPFEFNILEMMIKNLIQFENS